ncbi:MAG: pyruvate kinase [Solobacterium sp.]|nr:pyruvate kinase [Solobacterium sp.]
MTEIFGTLGPACADEETLIRMFEAGMDGIRLNMSHTSLRKSSGLLAVYRNAAAQAQKKAELLIDLQGPEIRIGTLCAPAVLHKDDLVLFAQEDGIPVPRSVAAAVCEGDEVLLDDGRIAGIAEEKKNGGFTLRITHGGSLESRKSLKVRNRDIIGDALTEQDIENLKDAPAYGVTAVMEPFVTSGSQLREVREKMRLCGCGDMRIFAKIENMEGVRNIADIIPEADMIVIARGDLGNDMDLWALPAVQKEIEQACRRMNRDFLVVTQMLTSMIASPVPTRAEVSDIFNAVADGAAAVMVTNETAAGAYPAEVIRYLKKTAEAAEQWIISHPDRHV